MAIVFLGLGVFFALVGLVGGVYSLDMLPTERGIAGSIASAVFVAGGLVTAAVGAAVYKLEALLQLLGAAAVEPVPARPESAPENARPAPTLEQPALRVEPVPAPVAIEVPRAVATSPAPAVEPRPVELSLPKSVSTAPRQLATGAALAAGAAVATAGAATLAGKAKAATEEVRDLPEALVPTPARPHKQPEPELPVEVLPPIDTTLREIKEREADAAKVQAADPAAADLAKLDPIGDFVAELDRLIPLTPAKPARPEPAPVAEPAPVPEAKAEPEAAEPAAEASVAETVHAPEATHPETRKPAEAVEIIGAYESGGAKYTMYSDGSVMAEADGQTMRFNSLEELREFIDGGHKPA